MLVSIKSILSESKSTSLLGVLEVSLKRFKLAIFLELASAYKPAITSFPVVPLSASKLIVVPSIVKL